MILTSKQKNDDEIRDIHKKHIIILWLLQLHIQQITKSILKYTMFTRPNHSSKDRVL